jgi:hypothetical protein
VDDPAAHGYSSELWSAVDKITRCPRSWWQLVSVYRTLPAGYDSKTLSSVAGLTGAEVSAIESANERHTAGPGTLQLFSDLNIHIATIYTYTLVYFNGEDGPPSIQNKNGTFFDPARTLRVFDAALLNDMRLSKGQTTSVAGGSSGAAHKPVPKVRPGDVGRAVAFAADAAGSSGTAAVAAPFAPSKHRSSSQGDYSPQPDAETTARGVLEILRDNPDVRREVAALQQGVLKKYEAGVIAEMRRRSGGGVGPRVYFGKDGQLILFTLCEWADLIRAAGGGGMLDCR